MSDKLEVIIAVVIGGVLFFGVVIPIWQMGILKDNVENTSEIIQTGAESVKDIDYSGLVEAGKTVCNIDDILVEKIIFDGIHQGMYNNAGWTEIEILHNWEVNQTATACEVAILDDMFSKNENGNVWKGQLGIKSAMKNVKACTIVECIDEYGLIELIDDKK